MKASTMQTASCYIDTFSLSYFCFKSRNARVDYAKLKTHLLSLYDVTEWRAYCTLKSDTNFSELLGTLNALQFKLMTATIDRAITPRKSWCADLCIHAIHDRNPVLIFGTGDIDLVPLYKYLLQVNKKVIILTPQPHMSIGNIATCLPFPDSLYQ